MSKKEKRYSLREMEHIAVNYAINCQKGYQGSFRDYMKSVNPDWRKWLKQRDKEELVKTNKTNTTVSKPTIKKKDIAEEYYKDYVSNGCDCLQMWCPICHG